MTATTAPGTYPELMAAVRVLTARCDGARYRDDAGWSKYDATFGRSLARQAAWSPRQASAAHRMVRHYRRQLTRIGIEYDAIPEPDHVDVAYDAPAASVATAELPGVAPSLTVQFNGALFALAFPYSPAMVLEVRNIPGRRFDGNRKFWTVPLAGWEALDSFAVQYGFSYSPKAAAAISELKLRTAASVATDSDVHVPNLGGELRPFQRAGVEYALRAKRLFIADEMGLGKAQPLSEPVLTPSGWRPMAGIRVGDQVVAQDGQPTLVTGVFPQGPQQIVRVEFTDGSWTRATWDHLWRVQHVRNDSAARNPRTGGKHRVMTTRAIASTLKDGVGSLSWKIPLTAPVTFTTSNPLPIDPYVLGLILGDGGISQQSVNFTTSDPELAAEISARLPGIEARKLPAQYASRLVGPGAGRANWLIRSLKELGLMGRGSATKFVPGAYLVAAQAARLDLLRGLLDTDGYRTNYGVAEYGSKSLDLADAVTELAQSLGGVVRRATRTLEDGSLFYRVHVKLDVCPFRLARKALNWAPAVKYGPRRIIKAIIEDGVEDAQCIRVEHPSHTYLTRNYVVTHNTVQALATLEGAAAFPALVVCPASLKLNWAREAKTWLPHRSVEILAGRAAENPLFYGFEAEICIVNYDLLAAREEELAHRNFKAVVFDEAHALKTRKAQRTRAAKAIAQDRPYRIMLSGTPLLNRPAELITQLEVLGRLDDMGGWHDFNKRYLGAAGTTPLQELNRRLRAVCYVRRLKLEVLTELPPKQRTAVPFDLTNRREYEYASQDLIRWLREREGAAAAEVAERAEVLVRISKLRLMAAQGKLKGVGEWVSNFLESGSKIVLFAHHREIQAELIRQHPGCAQILGDDSMYTRQANVDRFQQDPNCRLIVCSLKAGGLGVTLTAASNVAFVEQGWNLPEMAQAEDRCHRIGQKDSVTSYWLLAQNTIDEMISDLILSKAAVVDAATEGRAMDDTKVLGDLVGKLLGRQ